VADRLWAGYSPSNPCCKNKTWKYRSGSYGRIWIIPIEAALLEKSCFVVSLNLFAPAAKRASVNACNTRLERFEAITGDALRVPFKSGCVDAVVCDLPFGIRHSLVGGNEMNSNPQVVYPAVLHEMQCILIKGGRVVMLTKHSALLLRSAKSQESDWAVVSCKEVKRWYVFFLKCFHEEKKLIV